jgi:hypothetical protein
MHHGTIRKKEGIIRNFNGSFVPCIYGKVPAAMHHGTIRKKEGIIRKLNGYLVL